MKHEEKSPKTKKSLSASLKRHMKTEPLNRITVQQLIEDCNLNRKTFYYHFRDIYDLLHWTFTEESVGVIKRFNLTNDMESAIDFIMDYVDENRNVLNCALDSLGRDLLKKFFYNDFIEVVRALILDLENKLGSSLPNDFREFLCAFYTEATAGVLCEWIKNSDNHDRNTTKENITFIMSESLPNIIRSKSTRDNA